MTDELKSGNLRAPDKNESKHPFISSTIARLSRRREKKMCAFSEIYFFHFAMDPIHGRMSSFCNVQSVGRSRAGNASNNRTTDEATG